MSVAVLVALFIPLTLASLAWACVPQGGVRLSTSSAMPKSTVSVEVTGFPAQELVNLRWNAPDGPILASGTGPAFTANITVPDVPGGFYVVVARATDEHAEHSEARAVLEVMGSGGTPPPPPPPPPAGPGTPPSSLNPFGPGAAAVNPAATGTSPTTGMVINGTNGNDRLVGTARNDVITCGRGNDTVIGGGGNDKIDCGSGNDKVDGGAGNDDIRGGAGKDSLTGGAGKDKISGGDGNDKLAGGSDADQLSGGNGVDTLRGNGGKDRLSGGGSRDLLYTGSGDRLVGASRDRIFR